MKIPFQPIKTLWVLLACTLSPWMLVHAQSNTDCQFIPECDVFGATPQWTSQANTGNYAALVAGDIDADGIPEVVANRPFSNTFFIIDGATGATEVTFNSPYRPGDGAGIAIGDTDNDGFGEIYAPAGGRVVAFEHTGALKFISPPLTGVGRTVVCLADFDQDGNAEAYVGNHIVSAQTGAVLATGNYSGGIGRSPNRNDFEQPVAVDALPDNFCSDCSGLELVAGNTVYAVNLTAGTLTAVVTAPAGYSDGYTSVADFDRDGDVDALVQGRVNGVNAVYGWDLQSGGVLGVFNTGLAVAGRVNISDLDGDGELEASFAGRNAIVAIDNDFTQMWRQSTQDLSSGITGTSVFDFCGDGSFEVAYRDELKIAVYDGATGTILWNVPCQSATHIENPLILDVDADGQTEMLTSCGTNTIAYESSTSPWLPSRNLWNQHAYFNVNVDDDLTIPAAQQAHWLQGDSLTLNTFMNQRPPVDSQFQVIFAAADVAFGSATVTCNADTATVSLEICNQGDNTFPAGAPISFYDADPTSSAANLIASGATSTNIAAGACFTETFTVPVSSMPVFAVVNDNGSLPTPFDLANDFPNTPIGECDFTNNLTSFVPVCCPSATIDCCADTFICEGSSVDIPVYFSGAGPFTFTYSDGQGTQSITTNDNPYLLTLSPSQTTTYELTGVSDQGSTCSGDVCGNVTIGVNDCNSNNCGSICFAADINSVSLDANNCYVVEMEVSCDNSCNHALSNFSFSIPCGTVSSISNSEGWPVVQTNPNGDPNSGLHGWKVDDIQDFCEDQTPGSFTVTYTLCPDSQSCSSSFCPPLVAYKAAGCVQYGEASLNVPVPAASGGQGGGNIVQEFISTPQSDPETQARIGVFPNPTSSFLNIQVFSPDANEVEVSIYDPSGRKVFDVPAHQVDAGEHVYYWAGSEGPVTAAKGIFFVRVRVGDEFLVKKALVQQR